jgi:hypothetical protein
MVPAVPCIPGGNGAATLIVVRGGFAFRPVFFDFAQAHPRFGSPSTVFAAGRVHHTLQLCNVTFFARQVQACIKLPSRFPLENREKKIEKKTARF